MDLAMSLVDTKSVYCLVVSCMLMNLLFGSRGSDPFPNIMKDFFFTGNSLWCIDNVCAYMWFLGDMTL